MRQEKPGKVNHCLRLSLWVDKYPLCSNNLQFSLNVMCRIISFSLIPPLASLSVFAYINCEGKAYPPDFFLH